MSTAVTVKIPAPNSSASASAAGAGTDAGADSTSRPPPAPQLHIDTKQGAGFTNFLMAARAQWLAISLEATSGKKCKQRVHVVMGNEAADMDSIVSAVVYAYFKHSTTGTAHISAMN